MSSKRRVRAKQCGSKEKYCSVVEARNVLFRLKRELGRLGMVPYKCKFCKKWHLGHAPGRFFALV